MGVSAHLCEEKGEEEEGRSCLISTFEVEQRWSTYHVCDGETEMRYSMFLDRRRLYELSKRTWSCPRVGRIQSPDVRPFSALIFCTAIN
mmetsp:Transcript_30333/g.68577  ORF Transcript_30333/g.68577 Transcript_30333/m.68577 type:complete len:89 (+) Transcript_30333:42-308(+)